MSAVCLHTFFSQLCDDNWNQTLVIPLASSGKNDDHSNEIIYTLTPIGKNSFSSTIFVTLFTIFILIFFVKSFFFSVRSKHSQWSNYELPAIKIVLAPSSVEKYESCTLSASTSLLEPFSGLRGFNMSQAKNMAIYTIYQRTSGGSDIGEEIVTEIFLIQRIALKCGKSVNSSENPVCLNQNQLCF